MLHSFVLLALAGLLHSASANAALDINIPKLKSDFSKNNVTAQWAPGFPKEWGSEDSKTQFNEPEPEDFFDSAISADEKYLVMLNGTHVTFVDLDTNSAAATFGLKLGEGVTAFGLRLRSVPQGGYDVFADLVRTRYDTPATVVRQRLSASLALDGEQNSFIGGFGTISKQGKLVTMESYVYDLDVENSTLILDGQPELTDVSFSPAGDQLASVNWKTMVINLWDVKSGKKTRDLPTKGNQPWIAQHSPDGKYLAVCLGSRDNTIQIYTLNDNFTSVDINGFNYWPRQLAWSPDSKYLAVGDQGRMQIFKLPEMQLIQKWEIERTSGASVFELYDVAWLDGSKKFTFLYRTARFVYDLEDNVKWAVAQGTYDHSWGNERGFFLKKKGLLVTPNGDSIVRFWKL